MTTPAKMLPVCQNRKLNEAGLRVRCHSPGFACWVTGEFGRTAKILCLGCKAQLAATGWAVSFQIEGDKPAQSSEGETA